ncbi:hypothetical protein [Lysinibacter sp. HNR]|uniref:hypothetical protein n=1 Tax=Lysinibacter sp. HNR TaxID=3031408 RepID=UPI0024351B64|nr:hypothetical protein [Lysinibacter sp. HNR]WGD38479.1 hypothetical protein FrondiHNR_06100 [Lysinibacter sp. HNR]
MAGQTAAQKAAEEKAAKEAAEKAAKAAEAEKAAVVAAAAEVEPKATLYTVTGAAVVLRMSDGQERYLYRGAVVNGAEFAQSSIQHGVSIGLIKASD